MFRQVLASSGKERSWLWGVLEVVADMVGQCGSKRDARRPGERETNDHDPKVPTVTTKFRQVPAGSASSGRFRQVTQVPASYASSSMFLQVPASSASSDNDDNLLNRRVWLPF